VEIRHKDNNFECDTIPSKCVCGMIFFSSLEVQ